MPKQVTLLAGLHKTATTSIQQTCAANQKLLFRSGYVYPVLTGDPALDGSNHTWMVKWFRRDPSRIGLMSQHRLAERPGDGAQTLANLARTFARAPEHHMIIASESVSVFSADEMRKLQSWFNDQGRDIGLVCHVRHLSSWINSMIGQRIVSELQSPLPQAIEEFVQYGSIVRRRIETMWEVFPQADFRSHEEAVRHPRGPVGFFFENVGIRPAGPIRVVRANESSSDCALRVLSLVNEKFGRFSPQACGLTYTRHDAWFNLVRDIPGRKFTLRPLEAAPLLELLESDNEWLRTRLGEKFHDPRLSFEMLEPDWTPAAVAQFERALAAMPDPIREWVTANLDRLQLPRRG